jgi:hypothetical protein
MSKSGKYHPVKQESERTEGCMEIEVRILCNPPYTVGDIMLVNITYQIKSGQQRTKGFIKESTKEAIAFFNWRYAHKIIDVKIGN